MYDEAKEKNGLNRWTGFDTAVTLISLLVCMITLYPLWYVLAMSFSDPMLADAGHVTVWPVGFTLQSYQTVFDNLNFWKAFRNSMPKQPHMLNHPSDYVPQAWPPRSRSHQ